MLQQQRFHKFLRISHNVLVPILSEFLDIRATSRLDQAFCVHKHRTDFLEVLGCGEVVLRKKNTAYTSEQCNLRYDSFMRWCVTRNVKVDFLYFMYEHDADDEAAFAQFVQLTGRCVTECAIDDTMVGYWLLQYWQDCANLKSLKWLCKVQFLQLAQILARSPTLEKLVLSALVGPDTGCFEGIVCKNVSSVTLVRASGECEFPWLSSTFPNLIALSIFAIHFPTCMINVIVSFPGLRKLTYRNGATNSDVRRIADACPLLTHVDIISPANVTDAGMTYLFSHCTQLESVALRANWRLSDQVLQTMNQYLCASIKHIQLIDCARAYNLMELQQCRLLESLDIRGISAYARTEHLVEIFEHTPLLRSLRMESVVGVSDNVLQSLAENCPLLHNLYLEESTSFTFAGVMALVQRASQLRKLEIYDEVKSFLTSFEEDVRKCNPLLEVHVRFADES